MSTILKIDEVGTVLTGKTPKTSASEFWDGNLPFYTPSDMDGRRRLDGVKRYITEEGLKSVKNSAIPPNSVMVSCIGSDMGKVSLSVQHGVTNQQINTIIPNEEMVDFLYLYYSLLPRKSELQMLASGGSAQPILNKGQFSQLEVVIPSLQDQKAIAHILGTLDDKIELNQKMNQTLEDIAKAIFKSWFVDFDPVRAKAEGRHTGLPPEISDLFPNEMVDSEIGEIPKGWESLMILDVAKVTSGKRPPEKETAQTNACPYIVYGGAGPMAFCSKPLVFSKPAIITGRVGTLGKVFYLTDDCWVSDNSILICDAGLFTPLIFYTLQFMDLSVLNVGSTQPLVTGKDIKNLDLIGPPTELLQKYIDIFDLIKTRQSVADKERDTLSDLRDTLLPKLISGELRIPDAEKFLEEAGI